MMFFLLNVTRDNTANLSLKKGKSSELIVIVIHQVPVFN